MIPPSELERFISDFEGRLAPVEKAADEAWWNLATSGTEEAQEEFVGAGREYTKLFSDPGEYEKLRSLYEDPDAAESPLLRRRVEVLYRMFAERQGDEEILGRVEELEAEANAIYGNHRSVVGGTKLGENEVRELLRSSEDQDLRKEAWEASKSVGGEVEDAIRKLARLEEPASQGARVRELLRPLSGASGDRRRRAGRDHGRARVGDRSAVQGTKEGHRRRAEGEVRR